MRYGYYGLRSGSDPLMSWKAGPPKSKRAMETYELGGLGSLGGSTLDFPMDLPAPGAPEPITPAVTRGYSPGRNYGSGLGGCGGGCGCAPCKGKAMGSAMPDHAHGGQDSVGDVQIGPVSLPWPALLAIGVGVYYVFKKKR